MAPVDRRHLPTAELGIEGPTAAVAARAAICDRHLPLGGGNAASSAAPAAFALAGLARLLGFALQCVPERGIGS